MASLRTTAATLTHEEIEALNQIARDHGRKWRDVLSDMWMNGSYRRFMCDLQYNRDAHVLQGLRNRRGGFEAVAEFRPTGILRPSRENERSKASYCKRR